MDDKSRATQTYTRRTRTEMRIFRGYLLLTNGPKYFRPIEEHPAARHQLFILRKTAAALESKFAIVGHDYARKIHSLADLPNLFAVLNEAKQEADDQANRHHIFIDDYTRLFRVTMPEFRTALWNALLEHASYITDLRQGKPLNTLDENTATMIRTGLLPQLRKRAPAKGRSKQQMAAQTAKARHVSAIVRSDAALRSAEQLKRAFDGYKASDPKIGFRAFVDSDAFKELRNSRGDSWTYRSGLRALKSVD